MKTVVFDVSGHGLGHLAQVGCVVSHLRRSDMRIIVRSPHASGLVESFCGGRVETRAALDEPTLVMQGPIIVDRAASAAAYEAFHFVWEAAIEQQAAALAELRPDLLVSDIPYASLAAAARLSLPSIALCSLNWRDVRAAYCGPQPEIAQTIEAAYQSAQVFLQPAPHLPMEWLRNARRIGPLARRGASRAHELRAKLGVTEKRKLVLVAFGGIAGGPELDFASAPEHFFISRARCGANTASFEDAGLPIIDLLASVDAVVTKDGYATLVEAAVNGARILMLAREDWPETPYFLDWGERNACFSAVSVDSSPITVIDALRALLLRSPPPPVEPRGNVEAAEYIVSSLAAS